MTFFPLTSSLQFLTPRPQKPIRFLISILISWIACLSVLLTNSLDAQTGQDFPAKVRGISTIELRNRLKNGEGIFLVDTRTAEEYYRLHVWGSINVPANDSALGKVLPENKEAPIVFYGLSADDSLSRVAAQTSREELGYINVSVYSDGFRQWRWNGYFLDGEGLHRYLSRRKDAPRDNIDRPQDVMDALGVGSEAIVADIGAGWGYFTVHLSQKVGKRGKVYAVEIVKPFVEQLQVRLAQAGITNVEVILGEVDNPHLPDGKLDGVLVFDTYHEMSHYAAMLHHLRNALSEDARMVIVDYEPKTRGLSREKYMKSHTIPADTVIKQVEDSGLRLVRQENAFISGHSRGEMYLLVFKKI